MKKIHAKNKQLKKHIWLLLLITFLPPYSFENVDKVIGNSNKQELNKAKETIPVKLCSNFEETLKKRRQSKQGIEESKLPFKKRSSVQQNPMVVDVESSGFSSQYEHFSIQKFSGSIKNLLNDELIPQSEQKTSDHSQSYKKPIYFVDSHLTVTPIEQGATLYYDYNGSLVQAQTENELPLDLTINSIGANTTPFQAQIGDELPLDSTINYIQAKTTPFQAQTGDELPLDSTIDSIGANTTPFQAQTEDGLPLNSTINYIQANTTSFQAQTEEESPLVSTTNYIEANTNPFQASETLSVQSYSISHSSDQNPFETVSNMASCCNSLYLNVDNGCYECEKDNSFLIMHLKELMGLGSLELRKELLIHLKYLSDLILEAYSLRLYIIAKDLTPDAERVRQFIIVSRFFQNQEIKMLSYDPVTYRNLEKQKRIKYYDEKSKLVYIFINFLYPQFLDLVRSLNLSDFFYNFTYYFYLTIKKEGNSRVSFLLILRDSNRYKDRKFATNIISKGDLGFISYILRRNIFLMESEEQKTICQKIKFFKKLKEQCPQKSDDSFSDLSKELKNILLFKKSNKFKINDQFIDIAQQVVKMEIQGYYKSIIDFIKRIILLNSDIILEIPNETQISSH